MTTTLAGLAVGLGILAGESFLLFLLILGAIELHTHIKERGRK